MSHSFLSLDMALIPQATKDNVPTFSKARFSNDGTRLLLDGYNPDGTLVHKLSTFRAWLQWEENPDATRDVILDYSVEYTAEEIRQRTSDPASIWYIPEEDV